MTTSAEQTQSLGEIADAGTQPAQSVETPVEKVAPAESTVPKEQSQESDPQSQQPEKGKMPDWVKERLRKNSEQKRRKDETIAQQGEYIRSLEEQLQKLKAPKIGDFQTTEEWINANNQHVTNQAAISTEKIRAEGELRMAQRESQMTESEIWSLQVEAAKSEYPDWDMVIKRVDAPTSPALQQALNQSPNKAEMLYILAKNPNDIYRLNSMSVFEIAQEFGKLQARFVQSKPAQPAAVPKAPIKPIDAQSTSAPRSEYRDWEAEANKKRGLF